MATNNSGGGRQIDLMKFVADDESGRTSWDLKKFLSSFVSSTSGFFMMESIWTYTTQRPSSLGIIIFGLLFGVGLGLFRCVAGRYAMAQISNVEVDVLFNQIEILVDAAKGKESGVKFQVIMEIVRLLTSRLGSKL